MKQLLTSIFGLLLASAIGCSSSNNSGKSLLGLAALTGTGQVSFSFDEASTGAAKSIAGSTNAPGVTALVVTITDASNNTVYNAVSLPVTSLNGQYITQPLTLAAGSYHLTSFAAVNSSGTALYASPIEGSALAYLVNDPLPINFTITKNQVSKLVPEVLSTATYTPGDFGFATFNFDIVETIDFLAGAQIYNKTISNYELTNSEIAVTSGGSTLYSGSLPAALTGVKIRDGYTSYIVTISKSGYASYSATFTNAELKQFTDSPLTVVLEPLKNITSYSIDGISADINGNSISLTLPYGTDPSSLVAVFTINAESVSVGSITQVSGTTSNNFTNPVIYTVNALDGTTSNYTVTITISTIPREGLIAEWLFDGNTDDTSGYGSNGVNYGATLTTDRFNNPDSSYYFDGTDYMDCGNNSILDINGTSMTISIWVNASSLPSSEGYIISKWGELYEGGAWILLMDNAGSFDYILYSGENFKAPATSINNWHHVVAVYNGSTVKIFIDTIERVSRSETRQIGDTNVSLVIGRHHSSGQGRYFNGNVDDVRIYNRALSQAEITSLYNEN